jgi:hypothetical protein
MTLAKTGNVFAAAGMTRGAAAGGVPGGSGWPISETGGRSAVNQHAGPVVSLSNHHLARSQCYVEASSPRRWRAHVGCGGLHGVAVSGIVGVRSPSLTLSDVEKLVDWKY